MTRTNESSKTTPMIAHADAAARRTAFTAQATASLLRGVTEWAQRELDTLASKGIEPDATADDLIQTIMTATWAGALAWDPTRIKLRTHVIDALRTAVRRMYRRLRAGGPVTVGLDALEPDSPVWGEVEESLAEVSGKAPEPITELAERLDEVLRKLAAHDPEALRVLDALPVASTITEIAEATGMDVVTARRARARLQALARRVPRALQGEIRAALGGKEPIRHDLEPALEPAGRTAGQRQVRVARAARAHARPRRALRRAQ